MKILKHQLFTADLGWALWRQGKKEEKEGGQGHQKKEASRRHLEWAVKLNSGHPDADALGDTYNDEKNRREALKQYKKSFQVASDYPRALRNYLEGELIENKNFGLLSGIHPNLETAIKRSNKLAEGDMGDCRQNNSFGRRS